MTMKKILAGVIASATVMAISAPAFAVEAPENTKPVTKPGETEYEAGVSVMSVELDVELPGAMKAFINPYGAQVKIGVKDAADVKSSDGIVSWAYEVVNNTKDFGIMIDVKNATATPSTGITLLTDAAPAKTGTKKALIELKAGADAAAVKYATGDTKSAAATETAGGRIALSTTAASLAKFAYAPAKTDTGSGKVYIGIVGALEKGDPAASTPVADPEWTDEDTITCAYTLKINPAPATAGDAF